MKYKLEASGLNNFQLFRSYVFSFFSPFDDWTFTYPFLRQFTLLYILYLYIAFVYIFICVWSEHLHELGLEIH